MVVDGHGHDLQAQGGQGLAGHRIAGVLDPDLVAGLQQEAAGQIDGVLGSGDHQHLAGLALQAARTAEITGQALAQLGQAARIGIAEVDGVHAPHRAMGQPPPDVQAARIHQRQAHGEGPLARIAGRLQGIEQGLGVGRVARRGGRAQGLGAEGRGQVQPDIGARAGAAVDPALGRQLLVGGHRRGARDAEASGQLAGRGQARAGGQGARGDGGADLGIDLAEHRRSGGPARDAPGMQIGPAAVHRRLPKWSWRFVGSGHWLKSTSSLATAA